MSELSLFHFDDGSQNFEDLGKANGIRYWLEDDLRAALGYETSQGFRSAITRAKQACLTLGFATEDIFILCDGHYKLTRFACYLIAMNGDSKKPQVAAAQVYFAALAETFHRHQDHAESIDRVLIRREMADGMKSIASTAKQHGVTCFAYFQNAGYRGMYNMDIARLSAFKESVRKSLFWIAWGRTSWPRTCFGSPRPKPRLRRTEFRGSRSWSRRQLRLVARFARR